MNTRLVRVLALFALALVTGCATVPAATADRDRVRFRETRTWRNPKVSADVFYDEHDLDELDFEDDLERIFGNGIDDVERKRAGVRIAVGVDNVQAYVQLFGEEIGSFDPTQLNAQTSVAFDDLYGIGIGARGEPILADISPHSKLVASYRIGFNLVSGEGRFTDQSGAGILKSATEEGDLFYLEEELRAGLGVDTYGFRVTVGVYASILSGTVEDDIVASSADDDLEFEAFNPGLYAELMYKHPGFPVRVGLRGTVGDAQGLEGFLGVVL